MQIEPNEGDAKDQWRVSGVQGASIFSSSSQRAIAELLLPEPERI
jgi:hypothetical protein